MRILEETPDGVRILRFSGELDATDVPEVRRRLDAAIAAGPPRLVLDLERVTFASAALLGCLLRARSLARRRGGDTVLSAPSHFVARLLRAAGLERALEACPGDREAVHRLRGAPSRVA